MKIILSTFSLFLLSFFLHAQYVFPGFETSMLCNNEVIRRTSIHDSLRQYSLVKKEYHVDTKSIKIDVYLSSEQGTLPEYLETDLAPDLPAPETQSSGQQLSWTLVENYYLDDVKINNDPLLSLKMVNPYFDCYDQVKYACDSVVVYRKKLRKECVPYTVHTTSNYRVSYDSLIVGFKDERTLNEDGNQCQAIGSKVYVDSTLIRLKNLPSQDEYFQVYCSDTVYTTCINPPCPVLINTQHVADFNECKKYTGSPILVKGSMLCHDDILVASKLPVEVEEYELESFDVKNEVRHGGILQSTELNYYFVKNEVDSRTTLSTNIKNFLPEPPAMIGGSNKKSALKINYYLNDEKLLGTSWTRVDFYSDCFDVQETNCGTITIHKNTYGRDCSIYINKKMNSYDINDNEIEVLFVDSLYNNFVVCLNDSYVLESEELTIDGLTNKDYQLSIKDSLYIDCSTVNCYESFLTDYHQPIASKQINIDYSSCIVNAGNEDKIITTTNIYPNPTTGLLFVDGQSGPITLRNGRGVVYTISGNESYDLSALPDGIYFLQLALENEDLKTVKIVKQ